MKLLWQIAIYDIHTCNTRGMLLPHQPSSQPSTLPHPFTFLSTPLPPDLLQCCQLNGAQSKLQRKRNSTEQVNGFFSSSLHVHVFKHINFLNIWLVIYVPVKMTHQGKELHQQLQLCFLLNLFLLKGCQSHCNNTDGINQRNNNHIKITAIISNILLSCMYEYCLHWVKVKSA